MYIKRGDSVRVHGNMSEVLVGARGTHSAIKARCAINELGMPDLHVMANEGKMQELLATSIEESVTKKARAEEGDRGSGGSMIDASSVMGNPLPQRGRIWGSGGVASGIGGGAVTGSSMDWMAFAASDGQLVTTSGQESRLRVAVVGASGRGARGVAPASASQLRGALPSSGGDGQPDASSSAVERMSWADAGLDEGANLRRSRSSQR